jgi:hypothetical protein
LGIAIAPTESQGGFRLFSDLLIENRLACQALVELSSLTDEVTALGAYAMAHHNREYLCCRRLLKSLRSGTFVAFLMSRVLFPKTCI